MNIKRITAVIISAPVAVLVVIPGIIQPEPVTVGKQDIKNIYPAGVTFVSQKKQVVFNVDENDPAGCFMYEGHGDGFLQSPSDFFK